MQHYIHVHSKPNRAARRRQRHLIVHQPKRPPPPPKPLPTPDLPIPEAPVIVQAPPIAVLAEEPAPPSPSPPEIEQTTPEPAPTGCAVTQAQLVAWFNKWRKPMRSWFRNRAGVPPGDIDDLAQEVFLRLLRYGTDKLVENPQGYLFRIASNVANEWRERARNAKPHDAEWLDDLVIESEAQPEEILMREDNVRAVQDALDRLPPRARMLVIQHSKGEGTYKQMAKEHGLTYRVVLRDLTRAYSSLRLRFHEEMD